MIYYKLILLNSCFEGTADDVAQRTSPFITKHDNGRYSTLKCLSDESTISDYSSTEYCSSIAINHKE